ncbi:MAG: hypothetical protein QOE90_2015 [Thermoplasmata archaeon]|jgi:hypothetical protein|nr:hypothetical protein [Thermoplasmata archaeon]
MAKKKTKKDGPRTEDPGDHHVHYSPDADPEKRPRTEDPGGHASADHVER